VRLFLALPRDPSAPALARSALRERATGLLPRSELSDLEITVTELVTNALEHGRGRIELTLQVERSKILGEVVDDGSGFESEIRDHGVNAVHGRGLGIVAALTSRWGVHEGSSHVWFEFDRHEDDDDPTPPELGESARPDELP
jgi:anti-sigma regulatory factor (Ser/Thr protein kinase)